MILTTSSTQTMLCQLATHALHFMHAADTIICMENGRVSEQGSYSDLISSDGTFARLTREFGGKRDVDAAEAVMREIDVSKASEDDELDSTAPKKQTGMMQVEERVTGAVSGSGT